jgi:type I restriction enzyme S subunit
MNEWKKVKLGDCIKEVNERTTKNNQYEVLTSSKSGIYSQEEYFDKQVASKDNTGYKIIKRGQFTYRSMSDNGTFTINRLENKDIGIVSPAYPVFEVTNINAEYLKYFFQSEEFRKAIYNLSQGSTRTALKYKDLSNIDILLPSIEEQEKIVKTLKKLDFIIEKYRNLLEEKDKLIKSQFTEMFEDKEFKEKTLDEISIISGEYGSNVSAMEYDETLPRYVRITDITENGKLDQNSLASPKNETNIEKYLLQYGDILFARTGATVGKTYLYDESDGICIYAGYCIRFRLNTKIVNPEYIFRYTQTRQYLKWVDIVKRGGAQPNINSKQYGSIIIPIPPIELQNKFEEFVKQVDKQKLLLEQQKQNYENLKKGLMQKLLTGKARVKI